MDSLPLRLKADLRRLGEAFPERIIEAIPITGLPEDAPELDLARRLAAYGELRMARICKLPSQEAALAKLAFVGLQQRLLSSIAAFARTLKAHRARLQKTFDGEVALAAPLAAKAFVAAPYSDDSAELDVEGESGEQAIEADEEETAEAATAPRFVAPQPEPQPGMLTPSDWLEHLTALDLGDDVRPLNAAVNFSASAATSENSQRCSGGSASSSRRRHSVRSRSRPPPAGFFSRTLSGEVGKPRASASRLAQRPAVIARLARVDWYRHGKCSLVIPVRLDADPQLARGVLPRRAVRAAVAAWPPERSRATAAAPVGCARAQRRPETRRSRPCCRRQRPRRRLGYSS